MDNSFEQSFYNSLNSSEPQPNQNQKSKYKRLAIFAIIAVVLLLAASGALVVKSIVDGNATANLPLEPEQPVSTTPAIPEALPAIRIGCEGYEQRYDFYLDNTYELTPILDPILIESGTYTIEESIITINPKDGSSKKISLNSNTLIVDGLSYSCTEYHDV